MTQVEVEIIIHPMSKFDLFRCWFWFSIGNKKRAQNIILAYLDREFGKTK